MGHLHAFLTTPVDRGVFHEVCAQRARRTVGYLLVLVVISTLAVAGRAAFGVHEMIERLLPVVDKIPTITIRDGEASANVPQPWQKRVGEDHGCEIVVIIDTTGATEQFRDDQCGALLKKRSLMLKEPEQRRVKEISLEKFPDGEFGPTLVKDWLNKLRWLVPLVLALLAFVWFLVAKSLQALFLTPFALLATRGRKRPLGFGQLYTVATYALGPAVLADVITWVTPLSLPFFPLVYLAIALIYTVVGARRVPDEPELTLL